MTSEQPIRLAVIGAGPGGYPAAFLGADLGMDVTLVDPEEHPGGVCLYRGCIPSKALLHVAKLVRESRAATEWGVRFGEPEIDLEALRAWKDGVVGRLTSGLGTLTKRRKVEHVRGLARFRDARTLHVRGNGELVEVGFDAAIVATGSVPIVPAALRLDSPRVWDSTAALELREVPETLLVVGGGYIGLELGSVYAALGSRVTVVEMTSGLLPGADRDLVAPLARRIEADLAEVMFDTRVTSMEEVEDGVRVHLAPTRGEPEERTVAAVLVAVGRAPNSAQLGLEETAARLDARGFIEVNAQRRTAEPSIYAVGDVVGQPMLAHKATHEARVAVEVIAGMPSAFAPAAIPAVVYTDPEVAWCGLTELGAREQGIEVDVAKFPWAASGRAMTIGRTEGLTKLILERGTERVLGVGIVGAGAGELIAEGVLAVEMGARASDVQLTIHAHPTLSETVMESAEVFFGQSPHYAGRSRPRSASSGPIA